MKKLLLLCLLAIPSLVIAFDNENALLDYLANDKGFVCSVPENDTSYPVNWNGDYIRVVNIEDSNGSVKKYKNLSYYKNITTGACFFKEIIPVKEYENE